MESPTKAKTLGKFLGSGYQITASYGHIRDLPKRKIGVDIKHDFEPDYVQTDKQKKQTAEIKKYAKEAKNIYLATDPDREGEAIAFHVAEILKRNSKSETLNSKFKRIVFHEITKSAIEHAVDSPRELDMPLVHAQQARRILDRLVGYKLSPLLWKKIRKGLSAGRVQSVAVRLIVEKEREIEAFKPVEYWDLNVTLSKTKSPEKTGSFGAPQDDKVSVKFVGEIKTGEQAAKIEKELRDENTHYKVASIEKKDFKRTPPAPFTTSTLQQNAANKLGWSAKKTMQVAQSLYEEGLITYHRTDSTNIAAEATEMAKLLIVKEFGEKYALSEPRIYKTKDKVAQEAHEAIRPAEIGFRIQDSGFNKDQYKLYDVIWKRFVACQMAEVIGESVKVIVIAGKHTLETKGETIAFDGWYKILDKDTEEKRLPELSEGEQLQFVDMKSEQKQTQPPVRYNDASLIKSMEEMGIGRPSTYAPTITTIQDRLYVEKIEKRFKPTEIGIAVNDFLVKNFPKIIDYEFTAQMEDDLDEIANKKHTWQKVIGDFYRPFEKHLETVTDTAARVKIEVEKTGERCPDCGQGDVVIRLGKFGKFLSCERFPECKYKANYENKIGMKCPKCGVGEVIIRKARSGRSFYGCNTYPKCDFASWTRPSPEATEGAAKPVVAEVAASVAS